MARYIEAVKTAEIISKKLNIPLCDLVDIFAEIPSADVEQKKDCEMCVNFGKHATEYPCSHCRNCYTDKFKIDETRTPKERGGEK